MDVRAARLDEVPFGRPLRVDAAGTPVVLARVGGSVYACGDTCAHQGGPLGEGRLRGARLACPWHGWMYDVRTGRCVLPARGAHIASYRVRVAGEDVWVDTGG